MCVLLGLVVLTLSSLVPGPAAAQDAPPPPPGQAPPPPPGQTPPPPVVDAGQVMVVTLTGLIDPILADLIRSSVDDATRTNVRGIIFQTDLEGSVIPDAELVELLGHIGRSPVPAHVWIGPTGSILQGEAAWLVLAADKVAMAPGTAISRAPAPTLPDAVRADLPGLGRLDAIRATSADDGETYDAERAKGAAITNEDAPTLGDLFVKLPGVQIREIQQGDETRREPVTQAVFSQLSFGAGFLHTAASPAVAYLMLTIGMSLLVFELFTAGVGVAGVIGAGALLLGSFGMASLPTRPWAVALLVLSMIAFAVDVQTGVPRFWTGAGLVLYVLGSLTLFDGVSMSWFTLVFAVGAVALAFLSGMPSMVRTRFSTPTIGREWMIGEEGRAVTDISPDGVVQIKGAQWRAYTNRATPIEQLDKVRVIGIEGLVLEVEPEEGAAKDYRDRRSPEERAAAHDA